MMLESLHKSVATWGAYLTAGHQYVTTMWHEDQVEHCLIHVTSAHDINQGPQQRHANSANQSPLSFINRNTLEPIAITEAFKISTKTCRNGHRCFLAKVSKAG